MTQAEIFLKKNYKIAWTAYKHHKTHNSVNLDFTKHKYLKSIYFDKSEYIVIKKSTQCGVTEYLIVRALTKAIQGYSILYVLPTFDLVVRFVRNRIDKSINNTEYYKALERAAREIDAKRAESVKLKDIGAGAIAFVGSFSTAGFTEFPADEVIIDELDECDQDNIEMAWERLSHSELRTQIKVANPTYEGFGIDAEYKDTDQNEWAIKCICNEYIFADWYKNVVRKVDDSVYVIRDKSYDKLSGKDLNLICHKCGRPIDRKGDGIWVSKKQNVKRGYHVSKLFSGTAKLSELITRFEKGLVNEKKMQRFENADLGLAASTEGARVTREMILDCIGDYNNAQPKDGMAIAGIDVGTFYHFVVKKPLHDGRLKTVYVGSIKNTEYLIEKLKEYNVKVGIIDALPETREARKIINQFKYFFLCYFGSGKSESINARDKTVTVDRTSSLDAVKESLLTKKIIYPKNIEGNEEFINQMTASTRVFVPDKKKYGQTGVFEWQEGSRDDHYFLATGYCLVAARLLVMLTKS